MRLRAEVFTRRSQDQGAERTRALAHAGRRSLTVPLPRRALARLAGHGELYVGVSAPQRVGMGIRVADGAFAGATLTFKAT